MAHVILCKTLTHSLAYEWLNLAGGVTIQVLLMLLLTLNKQQ